MKVDQRFSGLKSITWDLFIETGGTTKHQDAGLISFVYPIMKTNRPTCGPTNGSTAPQEVTCFGLIQQQVLVAPHLFSKAAESSGKDSFRGIQAPWWIYGQKREEFCFRKSTTLTSGKGWGRWEVSFRWVLEGWPTGDFFFERLKTILQHMGVS